MGIFKKSIRHSKGSNLDEKLKMLESELKKTDVAVNDSDKNFLYEQKNKENEVVKYSWREDAVPAKNDILTEEISIIRESKVNNNSIKNVRGHINTVEEELSLLRKQIFDEISENFLFNIPSIEKKVDKVLRIYNDLQEGLLNQPPETVTTDPLTPLDQNFVTIEELNKHYNLFINRIQEQIATVGGGGETKLKYLDDVVGIATNASAYDGKYLKYNHTLGRFVFEDVSGSVGAAITVSSTPPTSPTPGLLWFDKVLGRTFIYYDDGTSSQWVDTSPIGIATNNLNQTLNFGNTSTLGMSVGISTFNNNVVVGGATTALIVNGDARITGILTIGTSSLTLDGQNNTIKIGTGITLTETGSANYSGVITAVAFVGDGSLLTNLPGSGNSGYANTAGIATVAQGLTGTPNLSVGIVTASAFVGDGSLLTNLPGSGNSGYANTAGIATYASISGVSTYATTSGVSTYAQTAGVSTYASNAGISTYASIAGVSTYAQIAGVSTYSSTAGVSTYAQTAGIATSAGTATTATNLSDAANIITGTINKDRISTTNALTVLGDLYVSNNISFGGTVTQLNTEQLNIVDADIVLGIGTSFSPTDNTANHGGIAIASTEGTPLVDLNIVPGETNPATYKKLMWFKGDTIGVGITDAWLFNYAVGIGTTQVPNGVRLAAGNVKFTEFDLSAVRNINASGIVTGSSFRPSSGYYQSANGTNAFYVFDTSGDVSFQGKIVTNYIRSNTNINPTITVSDLDLQFARNVLTSGVTTSTGGFVGNLTGNATTAGYATTAGIATVAQGLTGTPDLNVGVVTAISYNGSGATLTGVITSLVAGTNITITQSSGIATISATAGGGGNYASIAGFSTYSGQAGFSTYSQVAGIATVAQGLSGNPNVSVGVITASTLNVTGVSTIAVGVVTALSGTNINYTGISTITFIRGNTLNYSGIATFGAGPVLISNTGTATTTGTAAQPLQVTGGAYVSGSVGVGTTNPRETLDVVGSIGVQASGTTNRFEIVHNSSLNSLDFNFI